MLNSMSTQGRPRRLWLQLDTLRARPPTHRARHRLVQRGGPVGTGRLELTQRSADIGQRVPVLTGCTVVRRTRRLAGVGDRIPELPVHAVKWLCRADPSAEQRHGGSDGSGCNGGDGRTASKTSHELIMPENADSQTRLSTKSRATA